MRAPVKAAAGVATACLVLVMLFDGAFCAPLALQRLGITPSHIYHGHLTQEAAGVVGTLAPDCTALDTRVPAADMVRALMDDHPNTSFLILAGVAQVSTFDFAHQRDTHSHLLQAFVTAAPGRVYGLLGARAPEPPLWEHDCERPVETDSSHWSPVRDLWWWWTWPALDEQTLATQPDVSRTSWEYILEPGWLPQGVDTNGDDNPMCSPALPSSLDTPFARTDSAHLVVCRRTGVLRPLCAVEEERLRGLPACATAALISKSASHEEAETKRLRLLSKTWHVDALYLLLRLPTNGKWIFAGA